MSGATFGSGGGTGWGRCRRLKVLLEKRVVSILFWDTFICASLFCIAEDNTNKSINNLLNGRSSIKIPHFA